MKILFLSLDSFDSYESHNIYADLLRAAIKEGHEVLSLLPAGKANREEVTESLGSKIVRLKTGQVTGNANFIKKGINTLRLGGIYKRAIKKYRKEFSYDIILYATPPITLYKAVKFAKKKSGAKTYLLLKDIFPQNALDLGILKKSGLKGLIYGYFRKVEKKYYKISDMIGCMSSKNAEYLLSHNTFIDPKKVCVNPNSIEIAPENTALPDKNSIRQKYSIPESARVFVYGGNLGRPQNVPFIVECLKKNADKDDRFFVISGKGSDYDVIKSYIGENKPSNMLLIGGLPTDEYDTLVSACDVGLIFLDYRFTIPNYPSRLLSYMKNSLPVIACTDESTDVGDDIVSGGFGWKCRSCDAAEFTAMVDEACSMELSEMRNNSSKYLAEHFSADESIRKILEFAEK